MRRPRLACVIVSFCPWPAWPAVHPCVPCRPLTPLPAPGLACPWPGLPLAWPAWPAGAPARSPPTPSVCLRPRPSRSASASWRSPSCSRTSRSVPCPRHAKQPLRLRCNGRVEFVKAWWGGGRRLEGLHGCCDTMGGASFLLPRLSTGNRLSSTKTED